MYAVQIHGIINFKFLKRQLEAKCRTPAHDRCITSDGLSRFTKWYLSPVASETRGAAEADFV